MKLGLLSDIHEHVEHLQAALREFDHRGVDQVVVLGDLFETGERIGETCRLLAEAQAVGVWGNHDLGLCVDPDDATRARYGPAVLEYMMTLRPRLAIDGCHFSHVEPWLDPEVFTDLWYYEGPPDSPEKLARIFDSGPHRVMFAGHYHRWLLATPERVLDWSGDEPVTLAPAQRYFAVVGALCEGRYAIRDTRTAELAPFNLL